MRGNPLPLILEALREVAGGYFVLRDGDEEYVIMPRREFEANGGNHEKEVQLPLPEREVNLFEISDDINREIALYQAGQFEEATKLDPWVEEDGDDEEQGKRVRFEPLRGDLPPELQE
jgi:hypothetical protein